MEGYSGLKTPPRSTQSFFGETLMGEGWRYAAFGRAGAFGPSASGRAMRGGGEVRLAAQHASWLGRCRTVLCMGMPDCAVHGPLPGFFFA